MAANAANWAKINDASNDAYMKAAVEIWTKGFINAISASIEAANSRARLKGQQSYRKFVPRKKVEELLYIRFVFNEDDEDSINYEKNFKKRWIWKLLEEKKWEEQQETDDA